MPLLLPWLQGRPGFSCGHDRARSRGCRRGEQDRGLARWARPNGYARCPRQDRPFLATAEPVAPRRRTDEPGAAALDEAAEGVGDSPRRAAQGLADGRRAELVVRVGDQVVVHHLAELAATEPAGGLLAL